MVLNVHLKSSLQATWLRNSFTRALWLTRTPQPLTLSNNFVYQHPTVSALASGLSFLVCEEERHDKTDDTNTSVAAMLRLVEQYSLTFPAHHPMGPAPPGRVYVVTGTTGSLGCALLSHLCSLPDVKEIYAINRSGKGNLRDRQTKELAQRGYRTKVMETGKVILLETDMDAHRLGLSDGMHDEVRYERYDMVARAHARHRFQARPHI